MATQFQFDCPHCLSKSAAFTSSFQWYERKDLSIARILAVCSVCENGIIVHSKRLNGSTHINLVDSNITFPGSDCRILASWPDSKIKTPDHLPHNIENFYKQGLTSLANRQWDAAGSMFRKTLDVATKSIDEGMKNLNLFKRIEKLVESGLITSAMGEWSHEIRIDGNDAVHDDEPETETDAKISQLFTEAFLTYTYSLPEMVSENRKKRDKSPSVKVIR